MREGVAARVHVWKFRDDIPVRDFGRLGISTYECRNCGVLADSDSETGEVSCDKPCIDPRSAAIPLGRST